MAPGNVIDQLISVGPAALRQVHAIANGCPRRDGIEAVQSQLSDFDGRNTQRRRRLWIGCRAIPVPTCANFVEESGSQGRGQSDGGRLRACRADIGEALGSRLSITIVDPVIEHEAGVQRMSRAEAVVHAGGPLPVIEQDDVRIVQRSYRHGEGRPARDRRRRLTGGRSKSANELARADRVRSHRGRRAWTSPRRGIEAVTHHAGLGALGRQQVLEQRRGCHA